MNNKKSKNFLWFSLIMAIFSLAGLITILFLIFTNRKEVEILKIEIYSEEQQIKDIDILKRLVSSTSDNRSKISALFVGSDNTVEFLEFLESLGRISGAKVEIVSVSVPNLPAPKKEKDKISGTPIQEVKIRFKGSGDWPAIYKFTGLVANLPFSVKVYGFDLTRSEGGIWEAVFEIAVDKI